MATAAARTQPRPSRARPQGRPALRPQTRVRRTAVRPRLAGSVVWIGLVATLLAGIVALNVAVLRLSVESERLDAEKQKLVVEHDTLASKVSRAAAAGRIEAIAGGMLGLEEPVETTYLRLGRAER
jgi:cell division protein FtsL